ncbi:RagB/SusD family nutrient uptake outer membrane protein [Chryseobacterium arthrosphaerae]|uniref:RagB/SusD family nutrient uptake outer membrane protein n=1 Tax=Chryseobacterium arthrosphaerae TaxID=651561 RepID=A0A432DTC1_9FLAO|nr:RagB/SusD family nutrient uptake outer membrane protein [Chryseobacterium arthrosphaerae]
MILTRTSITYLELQENLEKNLYLKLTVSVLLNSEEASMPKYRGKKPVWLGFFTPSQALENAFESGDIRKELTILRNGETTPEGDLIAMGDPNSVTTFNQKVYVPKALNNSACAYGSRQNIRILRFAEILLINAEAANELGNTATAITNLNRVRTRAQLGGLQLQHRER